MAGALLCITDARGVRGAGRNMPKNMTVVLGKSAHMRSGPELLEHVPAPCRQLPR